MSRVTGQPQTHTVRPKVAGVFSPQAGGSWTLTSYQQLTVSDREHYGWGITCQAASVLILVFLPLAFSQGGPDKGSAAIDRSLLTACVRR